jgi:SAM-dependent methyltransferase
MTTWHDDDEFWNLMAPFMFGEERWAGTPAEVDQLVQLVDLAPESIVLDLACGPGRHSLELARRGHMVTGVDRTVSYLRQAHYRAAGEGLDIDFVENDMREFCRPDSYDLAISVFTAFGYFEDPDENQRVLRNVYDSLHEGGVFVLELMGKEALARVFQERDWQEQDGLLMLEERRPVKDWSWMDARWILIDGTRRLEYQFGHWIYSAVELKEMLLEASFASVFCFGSLAGEPYDQHARRLTAVARKQ